jgi:prefoldin beta subunit
MVNVEISPQAQHMLLQLQQYQQQSEVLTLQKQQMEIQLNEIMSALDILRDLKSKTVYKSVGPILVNSEKSVVEKELNDKKETLELRIKTLSKQEVKLKSKIQELSSKVATMLQQSGYISGGR